MNIKKAVFNIIFGVVIFSSILSMEREYVNYDQALRRAVREGIKEPFLSELNNQLWKIAQTKKKNRISQAQALELISVAKAKQVSAQSIQQKKLVQLRPFVFGLPFVNTEKSNLQQQRYERTIEMLEKLRKEALQLQQAGKIVQAIEITRKQSQLFATYVKYLQEESASKYFYTGDLLWRYLGVRDFIFSIRIHPVHGPVFITPKVNLKNSLIYLVSYNQIENTCGFSALSNAAALQQQLSKKERIRFGNTRIMAQSFLTQTSKTSPEFKDLEKGRGFTYASESDILPVAKRLGILNNILTFDVAETPIFELSNIEYVNQLRDNPKQYGKRIEDIVKQFKENEISHIIFNIKQAHWVLVSVINNNGNYKIFYMNSSNGPWESDSPVAQLIQFVDTLIEKAKLIKKK